MPWLCYKKKVFAAYWRRYLEEHREGVPKGEWRTIRWSFVDAISVHQNCAELIWLRQGSGPSRCWRNYFLNILEQICILWRKVEFFWFLRNIFVCNEKKNCFIFRGIWRIFSMLCVCYEKEMFLVIDLGTFCFACGEKANTQACWTDGHPNSLGYG